MPRDLNSPPWSSAEFTAQLRAVGAAQYHDKHPFHLRMNAGSLTRQQLQLWVANRFYYQKTIPIKDATLLSRIPLRDVRREWIVRIHDHDGFRDDPGGIERWLRLGEGVGLSRAELEEEVHVLPGTRFAVDAYVTFVATRPWIEGVASSLTELFAPDLMTRRIAAFKTHYPFVDGEALAYFQSRPPLARRDSQYALSLVHAHCHSRGEQSAAVAALRFKCDLLWSQLDVLYTACFPPAAGAQTREAQRLALARFARYRWDAVRGEHQLVFPEGLLVLNETGAKIVQLCDGRTFAEISETLQREFPGEDILSDLASFLQRLKAKRLLIEPDEAESHFGAPA